MKEPPLRYSGARQVQFTERWRQVLREAGPPPSIHVVPCVGYSANGIRFPSRWRERPQAKKE